MMSLVSTSLVGVAFWRVSAAAQQLPPGVGVAATPPCDPSTKLTPARTPAGFRPNAPQRTRLSETTEPGQALVLSGTVVGLRCGLIAGAVIDVWHADAKGVTDASGTHLRGQQRTSANGRYHVETVVPGAAPGQAPRVNMRVMVPGKTSLTTIVFLPDSLAGAANKLDKVFDPLLAMALLDRAPARLTASFNVILDL